VNGSEAPIRMPVAGGKWRTLLYVVLVGVVLFLGSILFILSRAPSP
jgi:hypothetical protein